MRCYVWEDCDPLTNRYHSNGGCVIVAESLDAARELYRARAKENYELTKAGKIDGKRATVLFDPPDHEYQISGDVEPRCFVFPDAGCC